MANLEFKSLFEDGRTTDFKEMIQSALYAYGDDRVRKELQHSFGYQHHITSYYRHKELTLRNDTRGRWYTGQGIHFIMDGQQFAPVVRAKVDFVRLRKRKDWVTILVNDRILDTKELFQFVSKDGFASVRHFIDYHFANTGFMEMHKVAISWTDLKF